MPLVLPLDTPLNEPVNVPVTRYAIGVEFCGTRFKGWQTQQAGVRSVQETVEKVLSKIANQPIIVHAAGRTDAGVHASNMVAHFDTTAIRPEHGWMMGANSQLPKDIALRWIQPMSFDFHARFKAIARRYCYVICNQKYRPALLYGQVTQIHQPLDISKMQVAAQLLVGTHDFSSFRAIACQSNQPVRTVKHANIITQGSLVLLDIQANGFLHHMVRNIMGVLLEIGAGNKPVQWIEELFAVCDRTKAAATAPPDGLFFINAYYPAQFNLPTLDLGPVWLHGVLQP